MVDTTNIALNLIVLTYDEEVIRWLDPDLAEIKETSSKDKCRKIEITYPLYEEYLESENNWYDQGHKIYIPNISGITNCLYVINTSYEIDYLEKNHIRVEAEEVLTEMNYDYVGFVNTQDVTTEVQVDKGNMTQIIEQDPEHAESRVFYYKEYITVTAEVLRELLGNYYDIETIELADNHKQITPAGTMSYMSLLRLIEEQTERKFFTTYINYENKIVRRLSLLDTSKVRHVAQTEYLDLNYNLESLELEISEENTYNAMAPEFSNSTTMTAEGTTGTTTTPTVTASTSTAQLVTNAENVAQPTTTSKDDLASIINNWMNYEVEYRQEVPMIIKEDEQKNLVTSATWYAPFQKLKNRLFIELPYQTGDAKYDTIQDYKTKITRAKIGKVSTSETIPEMIYNTLAKSLLEKLTPDFELKISVKDIQMLLGQSNLGYQLYETLYVRIPNFDYFVPCQITETVKNLHLPGENTIKVEANVGSRLNMKDTLITSHDLTMLPGQKNTISGILTTTDNEPLANQLVTINLRLKETVVGEYVNGYLETGEQVTQFDKLKDTITLNKDELERLLKLVHYEIVKGNVYRDYVVRASNNKLYNLTWRGATEISKTYLRLNAIEYNTTINSDGSHIGGGVLRDPTVFRSMTIQYIPKTSRPTSSPGYNGDWKQWINYASTLYSDYLDYTETFSEEMYKLKKDVEPQSWFYHGSIPRTHLRGENNSINTFVGLVMWVYHSFFMKVFYAEVCIHIFDELQGASRAMSIVANYLRSEGFTVEEITFNEANVTLALEDLSTMKIVACVIKQDEYKDPIIIHRWDKKDGVVYASCTGIRPDQESGKIVRFSELKANEAFSYEPALVITPPHNLTKPSEIQPIKVHIPIKTASIQDVVPYTTESIQKAINTAYDTQSKNTQLDLMTISVPTQNTGGNNVSITLKQLRGLAYASMLTYHTSDIETTKQNIYFGEGSEAKKYYEHFGTEYDFFTPCNPRYSSYRPHYIVSTALFNLGIIRSYRDFFLSKKDTELTFNDIMGEVSTLIPGGEVKIVEASEANLRANVPKQLQHVFMRQFVVAYCKASVLNLNSNYDETVHPVLIYGVDGDSVRYQNISGKGNSPTDQYDTTIATKGTANPWQTTRMDTILGWINNAREQAPSGDGGMLLVFKRTK